MRLIEILREDLIKIELEAEDKWEAIEEMVNVLTATHEIRRRDRQELLSAVIEREKTMSTGLGHGIAIPHGASEQVEQFVGALGISRQGIDFQAIDGKPVYLVLLLAVPAQSFAQHVKTLAGIARLLNHEEFRQHLMHSATSQEVMELIEKEEGKEFFQDFGTLS
ncbi:PTS sugar transporter subunit IIA [candidate division KSB3 bacterium]|uniref:PTS sugar transporter subunit IIA n=1 Tax=candidate division KSB3 bacterium TaxID=2044937 RepID=A0A9D5JU92_9BACT|nr:PTS sugar transporter subunit IIA [candidate division KSB3 bacterium]MBD3323786.1 PTS sugar transporter subunit IIA [candidate division KSB3 bacterium]